MAIYRRVQKNGNYTIMSNYHLLDTSLSLKSRGLLSTILSLPDDWSFSIRGLATLCKEGETAVRTALQELSELGYLKRVEVRGKDGRFLDLEYIFLEYPGQMDMQPSEQDKMVKNVQKNLYHQLKNIRDQEQMANNRPPHMEKPSMAQPSVGNPHAEKPSMAQPSVGNPHTEKPSMAQPSVGNPHADLPHAENRPILNTKYTKIYNNIFKNNNKEKYIISPPPTSPSYSDQKPDGYLEEESRPSMIDLILKQIDYDCLKKNIGNALPLLQGVINIIQDVILSGQPQTVLRVERSYRDICSHFLLLDKKQMEYVLKILREQNGKIKNFRSYVIALLYNASLNTACTVDKPDTDPPGQKEMENRKQENKFNNFDSRHYDFEKLEQALLNSQ